MGLVPHQLHSALGDSQVVIDRYGDFLLRSQIPFRGLDGRVPEQELDLFEIASIFVAELMGWSAASALIGLGI